MTEIKLTKRYPQSRAEDITDAFMRGYEQGKNDGLKVGKQIVLGAFETYINADRKTESQTEETEMERLERIDNELEDAWARIRELTGEPQTERVETMSCQECKWWFTDSLKHGGYCQSLLYNHECRYEPEVDCRRCVHFTTDKCQKCFGKELFIDSGYITKLGQPETDCSWK